MLERKIYISVSFVTRQIISLEAILSGEREATTEETRLLIQLQNNINNLYTRDYEAVKSQFPQFFKDTSPKEKDLIQKRYIKTGEKTFPTAGQPPQPQQAIENKELLPVPTTAQQINNAVSIAINKVLGFKLLKLI